jgi:hypothetical protein
MNDIIDRCIEKLYFCSKWIPNNNFVGRTFDYVNKDERVIECIKNCNTEILEKLLEDDQVFYSTGYSYRCDTVLVYISLNKQLIKNIMKIDDYSLSIYKYDIETKYNLV